MDKIIYSEEQLLKRSFMPFSVLSVLLLVIVGFGMGFYRQLYHGKPYGNNPMSDTQLLLAGIITFFLLAGVFVIMLSGKLTTEVMSNGIRFRYFPFVMKYRFIALGDIETVTVCDYKPVAEFGGWGMRRILFKRKVAYSISGKTALRIRHKNGFETVIGTQKPSEMKKAIEKMLNYLNS